MSIVFSDSLVLTIQQQPDLSLKYARICYDKKAGTVAASSETAGFPAIAANNEMTYSSWKPTSGNAQTWELAFAEAQTVDYCGIAAHTLFDVGASVVVQKFDGIWTDVATMLPTSNNPLLFMFDEVTVTKMRIVINGGSSAPRISVIQFGKSLVMPHAIYGGHSPITLSRQTVIRPNVSEGGQFLGRSIVRSGSKSSYSWQHLDSNWYRNYFDPFVEYARSKPFFIAWRPDRYPNEVGYVWTQQDVIPQNMGIRNLMSVTLDVEGLAIE